MSHPTPVTEEVTPPSAETVQPSSEPTETVEELKARLAAAETEAKRWKNRVAEENPKKKVDPPSVSEEDLDWKIANVARVTLVKDTYQKHLDELQEAGAKLTPSLKDKALALAEAESGVTKASVEARASSLPPPSVDRSGTQKPKLTETDLALGIKPETVEEFADYVEGR